MDYNVSISLSDNLDQLVVQAKGKAEGKGIFCSSFKAKMCS